MNRPLSPHLQIYRLPWSAILSITHRITGCFLTFGFFMFVFWLWALADSQMMFEAVQIHVSAWYGQLLVFGWTLSLFYHLFNGIRHIIWDAGYWLSLKATNWSGLGVCILTVIMTFLVWLCAWYKV